MTPAGVPVIAATCGVLFGLLPERGERAERRERAPAERRRRSPSEAPLVSAVWTAVLVVGLATVAIKAAGPVLAGDRQLPQRTGRMVALVGPALLAALVATQAFSHARRSSSSTSAARACWRPRGAIALQARR